MARSRDTSTLRSQRVLLPVLESVESVWTEQAQRGNAEESMSDHYVNRGICGSVVMYRRCRINTPPIPCRSGYALNAWSYEFAHSTVTVLP